jgi:hypothetical protein
VGVLEKLGWKPPSSKQSGITDADTLFSDKTIQHIEKYYNEELRYINVAADGSDIGKDVDHRHSTLGAGKKAIPITLSQHLYQDDKSRYQDPKYNDKNAPLQIHCFGDSWTYGWDVKQEECFVHLLGDKNTSVWNYGGGKTGLDWAVKKVTEVYHNFNHRINQNFVYVITVPHSFRRMHFEDNGTARRTWDKPVAAETNEYNHFLYFYHHYEILNRLIGRDKIIWGTWDDEIPKKMIDVFFDLHDYAGRHPGPESHRLYAEQIKTIMRDSGWYNEQED